MLKKFSDFIQERKQIVENIQNVAATQPVVVKTLPKKEMIDTKKEEIIEKRKVDNISEKFELIGKIAKLPSQIKPSQSIIILENNKISKNKLHYIITKSSQNSITLLKYNEKADIKITEFINALLKHYEKNDKLKINNIIAEGTEHFSFIKNIPSNFIDMIYNDIVKLLK